MVTSEQGDSVRVLNFKNEKFRQGLYRVIASVHKVAHKDKASVGWIVRNFEKLHEIVILSVYVPAHSDFIRDSEKVPVIQTVKGVFLGMSFIWYGS